MDARTQKVRCQRHARLSRHVVVDSTPRVHADNASSHQPRWPLHPGFPLPPDASHWFTVHSLPKHQREDQRFASTPLMPSGLKRGGPGFRLSYIIQSSFLGMTSWRPHPACAVFLCLYSESSKCSITALISPISPRIPKWLSHDLPRQ